MNQLIIIEEEKKRKIKLTADLFLGWIFEQKSKKKLTSKSKFLDPENYEICRLWCREKWNKYGFTIIKKALNHSACVSIPAFIEICEFLKKPNNAK